MSFSWKEEYSVGIVEIDEQHKVLIATINKLYEAITQRKVQEELSGILDTLIQYTVQHFSTEEKYFVQYNFAGAQEHRSEHKKFTDKMVTFKKDVAGNSVQISFELIDFLEDWLIDHITDSDREYMQCFHDHGLQ